MLFKVNVGHAGVMTLKDGTKVNYGVKRITNDMQTMVYYTGKGLREMFKPNMNEEEKVIATELQKLDEGSLMKVGNLAKISLTDIKEME